MSSQFRREAQALVAVAEDTAGLAEVRRAAEALREPLSLITGPAQLLMERLPEGESGHAELAVITRNCEELLGRVDELYAAVRAASKAHVGFKKTGQLLARNLAELVQTGGGGETISPNDAQRFRVLVVDDCPDTRLFVSAVLSPFAEVAMASSAEEAFDLLHGEQPFDVVVSDVMMPTTSGDELARQIRRDFALRDTGVMLLTGRSDPGFRATVIHETVDDYLIKPFDTNELTARTLRLARDARTRSSLRKRAMTDALTDLPNRAALVARLEHHVRHQTPALSVVMVDIDHFKRVNDGWGHAVGDEVLRQVASVLARERTDGRMVARFGGEEFVVVLPRTDPAAALAHAEALSAEVARAPVVTDDGPLLVTISAGVATLRPEDADWSALLARADRRLYEAKDAGRNRVFGRTGLLPRR